MSDFKAPYIPKTALDSFTNSLYAERLDVGTREPVLSVSMKINQKNINWSNAIIKVQHFIRGEERTKSFDAETTPKYLYAALHALIKYSNIPYSSDEKPTCAWEIKGKKIVNGKMSNELITKAKLVVGRTKKGPFISVVHWNTNFPHIAFYAGLNDSQAVVPVTDDPEKLYDFVCNSAAGWAQQIMSLFGAVWKDETDKVLQQLRANGGNQNNNGYGGNQGGYGNNNGGGYGQSGGTTTAGPINGSGDDFNF